MAILEMVLGWVLTVSELVGLLIEIGGRSQRIA